MRYILDSNIFIQAHRFHYPFDVFPAFWDWLEKENKNETLCSLDGVLEEIKAGDDELAEWVKSLDSDRWFLKSTDEATQQCYAEMANVIMSNTQHQPYAKEDFLSKADLWLIAKAKIIDASVVTQEKSAPDSKKKIFIPDVCETFGVSYTNTIDLMRALGGRF